MTASAAADNGVVTVVTKLHPYTLAGGNSCCRYLQTRDANCCRWLAHLYVGLSHSHSFSVLIVISSSDIVGRRSVSVCVCVCACVRTSPDECIYASEDRRRRRLCLCVVAYMTTADDDRRRRPDQCRYVSRRVVRCVVAGLAVCGPMRPLKTRPTTDCAHARFCRCQCRRQTIRRRRFRRRSWRPTWSVFAFVVCFVIFSAFPLWSVPAHRRPAFAPTRAVHPAVDGSLDCARGENDQANKKQIYRRRDVTAIQYLHAAANVLQRRRFPAIIVIALLIVVARAKVCALLTAAVARRLCCVRLYAVALRSVVMCCDAYTGCRWRRIHCVR